MSKNQPHRIIAYWGASVTLGRRLSGVDCPHCLHTEDIFEPRCSITVYDQRDFGVRSHYLRNSLGRPAMIMNRVSIRQTLE